MDLTRRAFLCDVSGMALIARPTAKRALEDDAKHAPLHKTFQAASLRHPPEGRLGLELYSLRKELKKDLAGTLRTVRDWGFEHVELAGFPQMTPEDTSRALGNAGLHAVSMFVDYDRLRGDFAGVARDARTLGLEYVICGWIPHDKALTPADVDRAIASFDTWGAAARREKLRLGYHIHGYEFVASPDGTLMDTLFRRTNPE